MRVLFVRCHSPIKDHLSRRRSPASGVMRQEWTPRVHATGLINLTQSCPSFTGIHNILRTGYQQHYHVQRGDQGNGQTTGCIGSSLLSRMYHQARGQSSQGRSNSEPL